MTRQRKTHSAQFNPKVALEALRKRQTVNELARTRLEPVSARSLLGTTPNIHHAHSAC